VSAGRRPGEVHRDDRVLAQAAALHEENAEICRHGEQAAQRGLGLPVDADELLAAVAHLHHAHARAVPVEHLLGG
jgi:hypothetical protein